MGGIWTVLGTPVRMPPMLYPADNDHSPHSCRITSSPPIAGSGDINLTMRSETTLWRDGERIDARRGEAQVRAGRREERQSAAQPIR